MDVESRIKLFDRAQTDLIARINAGNAQLVTLDSDGTWHDWVVVVIARPTGVVYGTQCGCNACEQRYIEGFLAPCNGAKVDLDEGLVSSTPLMAPFHPGLHCSYGWPWHPLPAPSLDNLSQAVRQIPFWHYRSDNDCVREPLQLDFDRVDEICEGWVPVKTPSGSGVLLWDNCD